MSHYHSGFAINTYLKGPNSLPGSRGRLAPPPTPRPDNMASCSTPANKKLLSQSLLMIRSSKAHLIQTCPHFKAQQIVIWNVGKDLNLE